MMIVRLKNTGVAAACIFLWSAASSAFCGEAMDRASALFESHRFSLAAEAFSEVIAKEPRNAAAYRKRANCSEQMEEYEAALQDYDRAIEANPYLFDSYYDKALLLFNTLKKPEEAFETLTKGINSGKKKRDDREALARIYVLRSHLFRAKGELGRAAEDVTQSLYLIADPVAYMLRGELKKMLGEYASARVDFRRSLELSSSEDPEMAEMRDLAKQYIEECTREIKRAQEEKLRQAPQDSGL